MPKLVISSQVSDPEKLAAWTARRRDAFAWLVDRRGHHRFIDVKLPGDFVAPHQFAGMAAIACVLHGPQKVTVEVVNLDDYDRMFKTFCRAMTAG
jgi:hypothetical protein